MGGKPKKPKEEAEHLEAFEMYYAMGAAGEQRSYRKVAQQCNKSVTTINKWANKFRWQERIEERNLVVAEKMEKKAIQTVVDMKVRYRQTLQTIFEEMVKEMEKGKGTFPRIETMTDLEKFIKIDMMLMGQTTERIEIEDNRPQAVMTPIDEILAGDEDARRTVRELYARLSNAARSGSGVSKD